MSSSADASARLCLTCGLCCDGTLFADVELQSGDAAERLRALGQKLRRGKEAEGKAVLKFAQPCSALGADCRCAFYAERPARCREFDCALLRSVSAGERSADVALRRIREARKQRDAVQRALATLGDHDTALPLSKRFRSAKRALESGQPPAGLTWAEAAEAYGELTLAVSALQFTLSRDFYPDQPA
jgi:Fe-S-cluster containining protein